jgi:hypothetical protein
MPHNVHSTRQTAFRIPEGLLAGAKDEAEREGLTLTAWVLAAITEKLARTETRVTASVPPAAPVSPPQAARSAPASDPEPAAKNCRHRNLRMSKGICPDCHQPVGYK